MLIDTVYTYITFQEQASGIQVRSALGQSHGVYIGFLIKVQLSGWSKLPFVTNLKIEPV